MVEVSAVLILLEPVVGRLENLCDESISRSLIVVILSLLNTLSLKFLRIDAVFRIVVR
jgi:hypothetical protein